MPNNSSSCDKAMTELHDEALRYYTRYLAPEDQCSGRAFLDNLIAQHGPVVSDYPHWHPLVVAGEIDRSCPRTRPNNQRCGFRGLDHTRFLRSAIITCPYYEQEVFDSIDELEPPPCVRIRAESIDVPLYHPKAKPILITCDWADSMVDDGTIPASLAVPLLLEIEVPCWRESQVAETWETMRSYILGQPCGRRSSTFVNQETGQTLKSLWQTLINTGMFGPVYNR